MHSHNKSSLVFTLMFSVLLLGISVLQAQVTLPRVSPQASVNQRIGISDVTINYHSPGVKGREIWGKLVPYDMSSGVPFGSGNDFPWRAGANDNTTITFSDDVTIEGQPLAAGTYGFHIIPQENADWVLIFSNNSTSWGSFFYDETEDALRVSVSPQQVDHQEWLSYGFEDHTSNSSTAYLRWEKVKIPFKIEVDVSKVVLESLRNELRSLPGFGWQGPFQAANYCLRNDINHEEALTWIDRSINSTANFNNLRVKSQLLVKTGKTQEADKTMARALEVATENQINFYGYQLMNQNKIAEALDVFKMNVKRNPDSWNVYDSLAECYAKNGDNKSAIKNYKKALAKAPDTQKDRIAKAIKGLEGTN
ncbi:MAG: DUF2911 domain-containing protein [bacterium]